MGGSGCFGGSILVFLPVLDHIEERLQPGLHTSFTGVLIDRETDDRELLIFAELVQHRVCCDLR